MGNVAFGFRSVVFILQDLGKLFPLAALHPVLFLLLLLLFSNSLCLSQTKTHSSTHTNTHTRAHSRTPTYPEANLLNSHSSQEGNLILRRNFVKVRHVLQQTGNNQKGQPSPPRHFQVPFLVGGGWRGRDQPTTNDAKVGGFGLCLHFVKCWKFISFTLICLLPAFRRSG